MRGALPATHGKGSMIRQCYRWSGGVSPESGRGGVVGCAIACLRDALSVSFGIPAYRGRAVMPEIERKRRMSDLDILTAGLGPMDVVQASYGDLLAAGNEFYSLDSTGLLPKEILIGVPFVITGITYQAVPVAPKGKDQPRGFVSVEATIGDVPALSRAVQRRQVPNVNAVEELAVDPEERIVFNDGSTGIRRQLTNLLDSFDIITVGGTPTGDRRTDKRFDTPWSIGDKVQWESAGEQWRDQGDNPPVPYICQNHNGNALLIPARRGLRVSQYSDELFGDAETYYLG